MSESQTGDNAGELPEKTTTVQTVVCQRIKEYRNDKTRNRLFYYTFQTVIIVLTGITPVLVYVTKVKAYPAIFSALASITAGLSAAFKFRDKYEINKSSLEYLEKEFDNYSIGTGSYYKKEDLNGDTAQQREKNNLFMHNIDTIHQKWMSTLIGIRSSSSSADPGSAETKFNDPLVLAFSHKGVSSIDLTGVNFLAANNLDVNKITSAKNWKKAHYNPEFLKQLEDFQGNL